jgi:KDO2-lipid IV(A) lauroyltransferase
VNRWKPLRRRVRFRFLQLLLGLLARLPRRAGLALFARLGRLALYLRPSVRRQIVANVERVFPDWTPERTRRFTGDCAAALGRNLFDFVRLPRYSLAEIGRQVTVEGLEHLERARRPGVGVVGLGAHLGCWELIPFRLRAAGIPVAIIYRRLRDPDLDRYVAARRRRFDIETHDRDAGVRGMLRSLRRGALLGILTDQATRVDSVRAPFLGVDAWSPTAPVRLAWHAGAPIIPIVAVMRADGRQTMCFGEEVEVPPPGPGASRAEAEAALQAAVARCNAAIGELILEAKEQWVWFHDRWRD